MTLKVNIDVGDILNLRRRIQSAIHEALMNTQHELAQYETLMFATGGAIEGEGWKPISETTRKKRAAHGVDPNSPPLTARGILSRSWAVNVEATDAGGRVTLYFKPVYAEWDEEPWDLVPKHHYGDGARYPARPYFNVSTVREIFFETVEETMLKLR